MVLDRHSEDTTLPVDGDLEEHTSVARFADDGGNLHDCGDLGGEDEIQPLVPDYPDVTCDASSSVTLLRVTAGDEWIANSARVSNAGEFVTDRTKNARLIDSLMKHRHGIPFESGYLEVKVACPLFVAGQILRHRIGWSLSVKSGRYGTMGQVFYLPDSDRPLINVGSSMRPKLSFGDTPLATLERATLSIQKAYGAAWQAYHDLLDQGITHEVARIVLPEGIYTEFWARCNPRSLMSFLSLRVSHDANQYETHPQYETEEVAWALDDLLRQHWPDTYEAFLKYGRVAP